MQKFGAHLSIAGGLANALTKTQEIGGNCLQIFSSSPRQWQAITHSPEQIQAFREEKKRLGIDPVYFHASYLINLADPGRVGGISRTTLIKELTLAEKLDIRGTIIHLGSFKTASFEDIPEEAYLKLIKNISEVLSRTPESTLFIIENAGNRKIGMSLEQISQIIRDVNNPRVRVCLDTCHFHAAGYDLSTPEKFDIFFKSFDRLIGLDKLEVFQVNDSKDALSSFRDRHENMGEGQIPPEVFHLLLTDPRTKDKPFILETPGFDKKGPDKKNLDILKSLR